MTTPASFTLAGFRAYFDEFTPALYSDVKIQRGLTEASRLAGRLSTEAKLYCAAHLIVIHGERTLGADGRPSPDGGSGVVASETIGPRSVRYETADGRKFYERTEYGRMFLELANSTPRRHMPMVIG